MTRRPALATAALAAAKAAALAAALALALAPVSGAAEPPVKPGPGDKCPVCGMFVVKYPAWVAGVTFADGTRAFFDGAKDLFKFLADPARWTPGRTRADVRSMFVTDYYDLVQLDARAAFFVLGSDTYGPMGEELVPLAKRSDAEEFKKDHAGKRIVRFDEVTPELLKTLDD
jgi:nitrous oxide reductase accessory protein NosL